MTGRGQLKQQVDQLLRELGNSPTEVAGSLRDLGVLAAPRHPDDCAVAVYLTAVLGSDVRVRSLAVRKDHVKILASAPRRYRLFHLVRVSLPDPAREFVRAFDNMAYPALIRGAAERCDTVL